MPCLPEHLTCMPNALLRLGVWLASLGDKAPEVLSRLMDLLAKGVIRPHNGMIPCTLASTVVRHTLLANEHSQRCFSCSAHAKTHICSLTLCFLWCLLKRWWWDAGKKFPLEQANEAIQASEEPGRSSEGKYFLEG